jgi:hypothetical protein
MKTSQNESGEDGRRENGSSSYISRRRLFTRGGPALAGVALVGGFAAENASAASADGLLVAASDASPATQARADFLCDGINDQEEIIAAFNALPPPGGTIILSEGTFNIDSEIQRSTTGKRFWDNVQLVGQGRGTVLRNRIDHGASADAYAIVAAGIASDWVTGVGFCNLRISGQEYLTNTKGQHGIHFHYTQDCFFDRLWIDTMSEEAVVLERCRGLQGGTLWGSYLGSGVCDIAKAESQNINIDQIVGNITGQIEDAASFQIFDGGIANSNPSQINIGSIQLIKPGATGVQIASGSAINISQIYVLGQEVGPRDTLNGIHIYRGNGTAGPENVNIGQAIIRNCGHRGAGALAKRSVSIEDSLFVNCHQLIITKPWGDGLTLVNTRCGQFGQIIVHDNSDGGSTAWHAVRIDSGSANNSFDSVVIRGWNWNSNDGAGVSCLGDRNIFGKVQVAGDPAVTGADSWDIFFGAGADFNEIASAIISGHGLGGLLDNGTGNQVGLITKGTSGSNYKAYQTGGSDLIPSGSTSKQITHNLGFAPAAKNIVLTQTNNPSNDPGNIWISDITSTQFRVNCRADPGASGLAFAWQARAI